MSLAPMRAEWTMRGHVTDETAHAWLDGALETHAAAAVASHVHGCVTCSATVMEARRYREATSRIVAMADASALPRMVHESIDGAARSVEDGVAAIRALAENGAAPRALRGSGESKDNQWFARPALRIAAGIVFVIGASTYVLVNGMQRPRSGATMAAAAPLVQQSPAKSPASAPVNVNSNAAPAMPTATSVAVTRSQSSGARQTLARKSGTPPITVRDTITSAERAKVAALPATQQRVPPAAAPDTPEKRAPLVTVTGTVTTADGRAIEGAQAIVRGRVAVTDAAGRFLLKDVSPGDSLLLRRIGYTASHVVVADVKGDTANVSISLEASANRLSAVTVNSVADLLNANARGRCLRPTVVGRRDETPLFRELGGRLPSSGREWLLVVGWSGGTTSSAVEFTKERDGTQRATLRQSGSELQFTLRPDGARWTGTVEEQRNGRKHAQRITLDADSGSTCSY